MRFLLETSVLIDVLRRRRGRRQLLAELARAGHLLATTSLNVAEVYAGIRPGEEPQTETFLDGLDCYDLTRSAGQLAGKLKNELRRKGRTPAIPDTIIAAVALENR
jgi:predicted nucleic acid-binding protein